MTILEKRTADDRLFDIDCSKLLDADGTINAVGIITADGTTGLTFGTGVVNTQAVSYTDDETGITRTVAIGEPTNEMRRRFTLVLKGHIAIARARFPKGTRGIDLDPLARAALWQAGP